MGCTARAAFDAIEHAFVSVAYSNIWIQPLDGSSAKQLTDFKYKGNLLFDWSRDGKQRVISRGIWTNDLVLLSNFK